MKEIPLTQGYVALVDDEDHEWLSRWKWCVKVQHRTCYAHRRASRGDGKRKMIRMHQVILGTAPGLDTDHINGNGLDNRRVNLRKCTRHQHNGNSRSLLGSSSCFKGVSWQKRDQKWIAKIKVNGRPRYLGSFRVESEAAEVYKAAAAIAFGEFAAGVRGDRL